MKGEMKQKRTYCGGWHHAVLMAGLCPYDGHRRDEIRPPKNGSEYTNAELLSFVREAVKITLRRRNMMFQNMDLSSIVLVPGLKS